MGNLHGTPACCCSRFDFSGLSWGYRVRLLEDIGMIECECYTSSRLKIDSLWPERMQLRLSPEGWGEDRRWERTQTPTNIALEAELN
jgi:hypothetical protein